MGFPHVILKIQNLPSASRIFTLSALFSERRPEVGVGVRKREEESSAVFISPTLQFIVE
jgi:hypothetical protein